MKNMKNMKNMPLNKVKCHSCPFGEDGADFIRETVESRALKCSQICHGTNNKTLCRGSRDYQITLLHRMGLLNEPTDECFAETSKRMKAEE